MADRASEYPEHEKLQAVVDRSQAIGEFLDWLPEAGLALCSWQEAGNNGVPEYLWIPGKEKNRQPTRRDFAVDRAIPNPDFCWWGPGYRLASTSITKLLSQYFGIDLVRLEQEKRTLLDRQRALNEREAS